MSERTELLREIRDEVLNLTSSPLYAYRKENSYFPVIGQGNHYAKIMFIGEAPGENEAKTGRPFCGRSGHLLDELLASVTIPREEVYITNIVKDRPPENRDPTREEISLYAPFLERQINIIQPRVIATLGRFSMTYLLTYFQSPLASEKISQLHGKLIPIQTAYGEVTMLPLYHPSAGLRSTRNKEALFEDFKQLEAFK